MFLNSFQTLVIEPVPDKVPEFYESVLVKEERTILDSKGNKVRTETVEVPRKRLIENKEFLLDGITVDLFDVETSQKVGNNLHVMSGSFYDVPLDDRSDVIEQINNSLDSIESQLNASNNDSSTINFD